MSLKNEPYFCAQNNKFYHIHCFQEKILTEFDFIEKAITAPRHNKEATHIPHPLHSTFGMKIKSKLFLNSTKIQRLTDHNLTIINCFYFSS